MAIKFPKMHIAQSVVNRILNTADDIRANRQSAATINPVTPNVPDPTLEGADLDAKMMGGLQPVTAPDNADDAAIAGTVLTGGNSADAVKTNLLS